MGPEGLEAVSDGASVGSCLCIAEIVSRVLTGVLVARIVGKMYRTPLMFTADGRYTGWRLIEIDERIGMEKNSR